LWGGKYQVPVIDECQVTGRNCKDFSDQEGWICSVYERVFSWGGKAKRAKVKNSSR